MDGTSLERENPSGNQFVAFATRTGAVLLLDCTHLDCESAVPNEAMLEFEFKFEFQHSENLDGDT